MAIQTINIGSSANKGDGDPLRTAFKKINENFAELDVVSTKRDVVGSVYADDSTLLVDGVNGLIPSSVLSGALPAIDGSALTGVTATETDPIVGAITGIVKADGSGNISAAVAGTDYLTTVAFADITSKPTTVAGYGITDAYTKAEVDSSISSVTAGHFDFNITGDDSTVRTVTSGSTLQITGGTAITTASDVDGNITVTGVAQDFTWDSITGTPTTIADYGITDALQIGTTASTALAGNTALFDGNYGSLSGTPTLFSGAYADLSGKPTIPSNVSDLTNDSGFITSVPAQSFASLTSKPSTISGYGITDAYTKTEVDNLTTTLDGDLTGSVFGDDSTLLVDGVNNKIFGTVDATSLRTSEFSIALGRRAGQNNQGNTTVAVGFEAGNETQGTAAIAIGDSAGKTAQGSEAIAIGVTAGQTNQGIYSTAVGYQAGKTNQGQYSVAIGNEAGETNQAANSIVINASGTTLNNTTASSLVIKPIVNLAGTTHLQYNATSGQVTHSDTITATIVATTATPPTGNADAGATGEIRYDDNYLYIKTASGWKRTALGGIV